MQSHLPTSHSIDSFSPQELSQVDIIAIIVWKRRNDFFRAVWRFQMWFQIRFLYKHLLHKVLAYQSLCPNETPEPSPVVEIISSIVQKLCHTYFRFCTRTIICFCCIFIYLYLVWVYLNRSIFVFHLKDARAFRSEVVCGIVVQLVIGPHQFVQVVDLGFR